jgi:hypothetical protein
MGVVVVKIRIRAFIGGLIGGVIISAVMFNPLGYGEEPVKGSIKDPERPSVKEYYPDGKLLSETIYGETESEWMFKKYYENGQLQAEVPYKNGKREGIAKAYYKSGKLKGEMAYRNGNLEGPLRYNPNETSGEGTAAKEGPEA